MSQKQVKKCFHLLKNKQFDLIIGLMTFHSIITLVNKNSLEPNVGLVLEYIKVAEPKYALSFFRISSSL